ncbi:hypothetical protein ACJQWK_07851 [Exserohilum turcicum]
MPAAPPLPPPRPRNHYPYDFWPREPWDPDPSDGTEAMKLEEIGNNPNVWLQALPHQWPVRDEANMRGAKWLGNGAYGCAGLWCQVSATNTIERRFVIKEAKLKRGHWRDPILWRDQVPREIRIHQVVDEHRDNTTGGHRNLAQHYGYRLMMRQRRYRIYLNYYEGGDLSAALRNLPSPELEDRYTRPQKRQHPAPEEWNWDFDFLCYRKDDLLPQVLPERLICEIVDSLAAACQILHFGQVDSEVAPEGTHRVTHCDIKPDNIFIQPPEKYGEFPTFVLSDYGIGFFVHERRDADGIAPGLRAPPDNPDEYVFQDSQFDGRYAPETFEKVQKINPRPLGERTDVWQIGAVFFWLLTNGLGGSVDGPKCAYGNWLVYISDAFDIGRVGKDDGTDIFYEKNCATLLRYSPALRNLCARCLNWNPDDRPSLAKIRQEIREHLDAHPEVRDDRDMGILDVRRDDVFAIGAPFPANVP